MPMFAQVWLWSLLAFLLGSLLCWLLVARPARRRNGLLENRLATMRADAALAGRAQPDGRGADSRDDLAPAPRSLVPGFGDRDGPDDAQAESLTRAYTLPGVRDVPVAPPEHADPTQYIGALDAPLVEPRLPVDEQPRPEPGHGRDWFDSDSDEDARPVVDLPSQVSAGSLGQRLVDDDDDLEEHGTIFTQRTMPIPAELIREIDEAGRFAGGGAHAADDSLVDDLDDDLDDRRYDEPHRDRYDELHDERQEPYEEPSAEREDAGTAAAMAPVEPGTEVMSPVEAHAPLEADAARFDETEPEAEPEVAVAEPERAERDTVLSGPSTNGSTAPPTTVPDRPPGANTDVVPRILPHERTASFVPVLRPEPKVAHGATVEPERTQSVLPKRVPSKPQRSQTFHPFGVQTVTPAVSTGQEKMRSLFEPMVPAEAEADAVLPPPHRLRSGDGQSPGPFGPGSAMPLPGGASPSPDFTIKASVTALRYCTPDSPQFGRTVAEVWFRSAADAERVGFRPVG